MNHLMSCVAGLAGDAFFFMKKITLLFVILANIALVFSQNMVRNPGFDSLPDCLPTKEYWDAPYWRNMYLDSSLCTSPVASVPFLYHSCNNEAFPIFGAPLSRGRYYQEARSGQGYAETFLQVTYCLKDYRRYISTTVEKPLVAGHRYYGRFYVSPRNKIYLPTDPHPPEFYVDAVGMAVTDTFLPHRLPTLLAGLHPDIETRGKIIDDTLGWTPVAGCFTAKGGETEVVIGNFRSFEETLMGNLTYPNQLGFAIMYIEDVLLAERELHLPDTILLCNGAEKQLKASFFDAKIQWGNGSTDSVFTIKGPGIYTVRATIDHCEWTDTIVAIDPERQAAIPSDTVFCRGVPAFLSAAIPGVFEWSDGSDGQKIEVEAPGVYALTVTNDCGKYEFSTGADFEKCGCDFYVPNVFSPNGDGENDQLNWTVHCDFPFETAEFSIFDRWGNLIHHSNSETPSDFWDGTFRGKNLPTGVYAWMLKYHFTKFGEIENKVESGTVLISK